jgi:hypothetical protein
MTVYPCFEDEANTQLTKYKIIKGMGKEVPNILVTVRILLIMDGCFYAQNICTTYSV